MSEEVCDQCRPLFEKLVSRMDDLEKKNTALERRFLKYENAHTPLSLQEKKPPKEASPSGTLGATKGHKRWDRDDPEPTGSVEYLADSCSRCDHLLGDPIKTIRRIVEDTPEPQPVEVIEHLINCYECSNCGLEVEAEHDVSLSSFGKNTHAYVALLKFADRLPLRKVVASLQRHYGMKMTNVSVMNITDRVSKALNKEYYELIKNVRSSRVVYVDETSMRLTGENYWLWTFTTEKETVYVIHRKRSKKVIEEILGKTFDGIISCDGWTAYSKYRNKLQRCWAHILREAKGLSEKYKKFSGFYNSMKTLFKEIKTVKTKPPPLKKRIVLKEELTLKLEQLIEQMNSYQPFKKFANKIKKRTTILVHVRCSLVR